ncbi:putative quinol monooxygenase [Nocardia mexicana]|uniref:Antibiotic biosynthesis monooxygenase n=1 Tax=Nocardia mexicana TaxID=279262 RepID=A0A370HBV1_9NOCA|nr:antibiotic biosynthesis monooxygenase family protein [Nocardia mexicana]RDI54426.1 antibiotic biosynthesis monooxygenase [Nocardia mexicana]
MLIIAGYVTVDAERRDEFVAAHRDLVRRAREAPGCLDVAITADSLNPQRVNNFERWETRAHLDAWRAVADAPDTGIEFRNSNVMLYTIADIAPPFP